MTGDTNADADSTASHGVDWDEVLDLFGYPEPRDAQQQGMKTALETVADNGYYVLEGACGTGKTMLALTPLIALVRSNQTSFERIVVATSVKQQQRAFEDDLQQINSTLPDETDPVSGITLVGKKDVCPFVPEGTIESSDLYDECESLRDNTRDLINLDDNGEQRARTLANDASNTTTFADGDVAEPTDQWGEDAPDYPYPPTIQEDAGSEYCPFYAKHMENTLNDAANEREQNPNAIPFDLDSEGLVTTSDLLRLAGEAGTCPHSVMGEVMDRAEVVIANYYHLFEPTTISQFTGELIGEDTLLVCDEAHNLVPKVRDLLSESAAVSSIEHAQRELENIHDLASVDLDALAKAQGRDLDLKWERNRLSDDVLEEADRVSELVADDDTLATDVSEFVEFASATQEHLDKMDFDAERLGDLAEFLDKLRDVIDRKVAEKLTEEFGEYWQDNDHEDDIEVPLREPEDPDLDDITKWASFTSYGYKMMADAGAIGSFVNALIEQFHEEIREVETTPTVYADAVGSLLSSWEANDHTQYFRELELEPRFGSPMGDTEYAWQEYYTVDMCLQNCLPSDRLADQFDQFGGGIMMSATLEPLDVFRDISGVTPLAEKDRPVTEERFGLGFPEPNRESFAVNLPPFKYNKKGPTHNSWGDEPNLDNEVRQQYADALRAAVETTPGNVLISMPSYGEAQWAGDVLSDHSPNVSKPVIVDESSADWETEQRKESFFEGDGKVLVTGAHGTLVEGVDYEGDKLDTVIVVGVPLENSHNPYSKAIKTAFEEDDRFDGRGFKYAFSIPAVQKARQSLGRVIRGDDDVGVRLLFDERYTDADRWDSVRDLFPEEEQQEFNTVKSDSLDNRLTAFWSYHENRSVITQTDD